MSFQAFNSNRLMLMDRLDKLQEDQQVSRQQYQSSSQHLAHHGGKNGLSTMAHGGRRPVPGRERGDRWQPRGGTRSRRYVRGEFVLVYFLKRMEKFGFLQL